MGTQHPAYFYKVSKCSSCRAFGVALAIDETDHVIEVIEAYLRRHGSPPDNGRIEGPSTAARASGPRRGGEPTTFCSFSPRHASPAKRIKALVGPRRVGGYGRAHPPAARA